MSPCSKCIALLSPPSIAQSAVSAKLCQIRPLLRPDYHGRPSIPSPAEMVGKLSYELPRNAEDNGLSNDDFRPMRLSSGFALRAPA
jgi:hypothetical protein